MEEHPVPSGRQEQLLSDQHPRGPKGRGHERENEDQKIRTAVPGLLIPSQITYLTLHFTDEEVETQRVQLGLDLP